MIVRDWRSKVESRTARHARWLEDQPPVPAPVPPVARPCDHKFIDSPYCLKCGWRPPAPADPFPHRCPGAECAVCRWVATHPDR